jgi:cytoskeletal protein CcmA (bactofilin family)
MARRTHDDALGVAGADTVIGTGVKVTGDLSSESDIIIDGTLHGSVNAGGNVTIGVNASMTGDIKATNVTIAGQVHGNVHAAGEATIKETGHLKGDITCISLAVGSGGIFIGRSLMKEPPLLVTPPDINE